MRGHLPEVVRTRAKSPLGGWPFVELMKGIGPNAFDYIPAKLELDNYVELSNIIPRSDLHKPPISDWNAMRAHSLRAWLATENSVVKNF